MSVPLIGLGHDLALEALARFLIDPAIAEGVHYAQRDIAADGTIHEQGGFCVLLWPVIDGVEDLEAILTQLGLEDDTDQRAAITAYLPTTRRKWHLYNGWAIAPQTINYALWPNNVRVMLNRLEQIG